MIKIKKSQNADSRTMTGEPCKEKLIDASNSHISDVKKGCRFFAEMLLEAGEEHDWTKIHYIDDFYNDYAAGLVDDEFKAGKWFQIHKEKERHHLNDRCPDDVTLIDVLERVIDITMAGMARSGQVFDDTLDPDILQKAYRNTVKLLVSRIEVMD